MCTAFRVCMRDHSHNEIETVDTQYTIVTPATAGANGVGTYTATFTNPAFGTTAKNVEFYMVMMMTIKP